MRIILEMEIETGKRSSIPPCPVDIPNPGLMRNGITIFVLECEHKCSISEGIESSIKKRKKKKEKRKKKKAIQSS